MKKMEQIRMLRVLQGKRNCTEVCLIIFAAMKIICTSVLSAITCYWFSCVLHKYIIEQNQPPKPYYDYDDYDYYAREREQDATSAKIAGGTMFISVLSFVFSIILTVGLIKRKPRLLLAYFIYGIAMISSFLFAVILGTFVMLLPLLIFGASSVYPIFIITLIAVAYTIYAAILAVVLATYKKMGAESRDHSECLLPYSKVNLGFK